MYSKVFVMEIILINVVVHVALPDSKLLVKSLGILWYWFFFIILHYHCSLEQLLMLR